MLLRDLLLGGAHKLAVADDVLAADEQPVHPVRSRKDKPRDRVPGPGQLEHVRSPNREVGAAAGLDRTQVAAAEEGGAAARGQPERLAHSQGGGPVPATSDEQRLLDLKQ